MGECIEERQRVLNDVTSRLTLPGGILLELGDSTLSRRPRRREESTPRPLGRSICQIEWIAHRAGNTIDGLCHAEPLADLIEVDARFRRGVVEVRHAKRLWPTTRLWERWYLLPADTGRMALDELVAAARRDTHLFIDLKGLSQRVSHAVLRVLGDRSRFTVASKRPRLLVPFADRPSVDRIRSAGSRLELMALLWLPSRVRVDGYAVRSHLVDTGVARRLRRRADRLLVWGVDSLDDIARLERLGVTGVIVDDVGLIERWRDVATSRHS